MNTTPMGQFWQWWMTIVVIGFIVPEAWGYWQFGGDGTLSTWMRHLAGGHPVIPYVMACLGAILLVHIFGSKQ